MREMDTDRPDQTESPYTVDAGHFQVEMDLATHTLDHDTAHGNDVKTTRLAVAPMNVKVGLLNNVDLQLLVEIQASAAIGAVTSGFAERGL